MKLSRVIFVAILVVMATTVVKADGVIDPTIKINKTGPGDPPCPPIDSSYTCVDPDTNSYLNPVVVSALSLVNGFIDVSNNFANSGGSSGTEDLTSVWLAIETPLGPPPAIYTCTSDLFSSGCQQVNLPTCPPDNSFTCNTPAGAGFLEYFLDMGSLAPGDEMTVSITPEPSGLLLLSGGLLALFTLGLRRKRSSAYRA